MNTSSIISENYLDIINKKTSLEDLSKMADYICLGDVYKNYMLSNQSWEFSEYSGIFGTEAPSSLIRKNYKPIKKLKIANRFDFRFELEYCRTNVRDISYSLSKILFPLEPNAKWIKR